VTLARHSGRGWASWLRNAANTQPDRAAVMSSAAAWAIVVWVPVPVLRLIGTLPLVLWLPGAALLRLSSRRRPSVSAVDVAIATALSAAVSIFAGLGISLVTHQVPRLPFATILAGLAIIARLAAARMTPSIGQQQSASWPGGLQWPARRIVTTAAICCILTAFLGYLSYRLYDTPPPSDTYTTLSLNHQRGRLAIVVINHETSAMHFRLTVTHARHTTASNAFTLAVGGEYKLSLPSPSAANRGGRSIVRLIAEPGNRLYRSLVFH
jgi:hypothetical protein